MSSHNTYSSLGITRVYFAFCIIHKNCWAQMNKEIWIHVAGFSLLCKKNKIKSHFPSKMKPGSDCYRPHSFAQTSILFSIKHYSSFKKAPAKSYNDVRNSNWISSLTFGGKNSWDKMLEPKKLLSLEHFRNFLSVCTLIHKL